MIIENREVNSIEEAFNLLPEKTKDHCKRVSAYCELAFKQAVRKDMHLDTQKGQMQIVAENAKIAALSGLYHDIGKLLPDEEEEIIFGQEIEQKENVEVELDEHGEEIEKSSEGPKDHTGNGIEIITSLYPDFNKLSSVERTIFLDGIRDHHERLNGLGGPKGKKSAAISLMGRIVAIADLLDHHALADEGEDPIGTALENLKSEVKAGFLDEEFFKAFSSQRAKLKKIFIQSIGADVEVPKADQWIKRKATRPMQLVYKTAHLVQTSPDKIENHIWFAEMRFRGTTSNDLPYAEVAKNIAHNKLGQKLGQYFLYELCDGYKRFKEVGLNLSGAAMILPSAFFSNGKGMGKIIEAVFQDEDINKNEIYLIIPEEVMDKPNKTVATNIEECQALGLQLMEEYEFMGLADVEEDLPFETEEAIVKNQVKALSERARQNARWDAELEDNLD